MKPINLLTTICRISAVALLVTLHSCGKDTPKPSPLDELESNYNKWTKQSISDYQMAETMNCFCVYRGKHTITVTGNVVTSIKDANGNLVAIQNGGFKTIEELFEFARKSIASKPGDMHITYNKQYGYPESMYFDFNAGIADEEMGYLVAEFVVK